MQRGICSEEAINWIIDNQLGRRNLTDAQRSYLRGKRYETEKRDRGGDRKSEEYKKSNSNNYKIERTVDTIARQVNVSPGTISSDYEFSKVIDEVRETEPELAQKILTEEMLPKKDIVELTKDRTRIAKRYY